MRPAAPSAPSWPVLVALARALDPEPPPAPGHAERVATLARRLALACGWPTRRAQLLAQAALVHEVGRAGLRPAGAAAGRSLDELEIAAELVGAALSAEQASWVRHMGERFNGSGRPEGLCGAQIPQGARLLALADAWDTMISRAGPWGAPLCTRAALAECRRRAGQRFCPRAVAALGALAALDRPGDQRFGRRAGFAAPIVRPPPAALLPEDAVSR
jgi:HD-GYP domain-containing protein (c-di-GMP phosphodiesterase class II)